VGIGLCARLNGMVPTSYLIRDSFPPPGYHWFIQYSVFGETWVIAGMLPDLAPGGFPYGNDVEPD